MFFVISYQMREIGGSTLISEANLWDFSKFVENKFTDNLKYFANISLLLSILIVE